jgi:hypothetical protein
MGIEWYLPTSIRKNLDGFGIELFDHLSDERSQILQSLINGFILWIGVTIG